MLRFENIQWFMPEVYLTLGINLLLIFGLFGIKVNKFSELILINLFIIIINGILVAGLDNNGLLETNNLIITLKAIVTITTLIIINISPAKIQSLEYNILILLSLLGMLILISSCDFIMLYLGLELLSLSLYILATIKRGSQISTEAGLKYLILGAVSTGILLLGAALIYYMTGSTQFQDISTYLWYINKNEEGWVIMGAVLIIISLLFKLAAAPFHMWAPDVYEGSPTIVTAYFAIVPKIIILGVVIKLLLGAFIGISDILQPIILISALLSLIVGSFGAINQSKVKRLIAYSAIGHMGWMLIGIGGLTIYSFMSSIVYMIAYIIMSLTLFTIIIKTDNKYLVEWTGLSRKNPILAISIAITLLSMAGIPPMIGFYNKYLILIEAIQSNLWVIVGIGIITSVISAYYYLQIIKIMYFFENKDGLYKVLGDIVKADTKELNKKSTLILGSTIFIILSGLIYPQPLITLANLAITSTLI